jgi:hypothetical protein
VTPSTDSTTQLADAFGPFDGRVRLNAAHQGPPPRMGRPGLERMGFAKPRPRIEELRKLTLARGSVLLRGIGAAQADRQGERWCTVAGATSVRARPIS